MYAGPGIYNKAPPLLQGCIIETQLTCWYYYNNIYIYTIVVQINGIIIPYTIVRSPMRTLQMRNPIRSPIRTMQMRNPIFLQKPVFFDFLTYTIYYIDVYCFKKKTSENKKFCRCETIFADAKPHSQSKSRVCIPAGINLFFNPLSFIFKK